MENNMDKLTYTYQLRRFVKALHYSFKTLFNVFAETLRIEKILNSINKHGVKK